ncbi:MAG: DUF1552 domain-containing protein [Myxococcota bacterium]
MRLNRRRFLQGGGAAALGLPMLGNFARGGEAPVAPRLLIVWTPNDADWQEQYETPLVAGAALPASLPSFLQPLEAYRDRLAVLSGLRSDMEGGHTSIGNILTGTDWVGPDNNNFWGDGPSVDQHIAQSTGQPAITLGVACGVKNGKGRMSYLGAADPVDPFEDPALAFEALFADVDSDAEEIAARRARQHSILDRAAADLVKFTAEIPAEQRPRLEQHLDAVRALEDTIDNNLAASCDPTVPGMVDAADNALIPEIFRAQLTIAAQALGCGASRVASVQLTRAGGGNITPLWPEEGIDIGLNVHGIAHDHYLLPDDPTAQANAKAVERWYSTQIAHALEQLDAIPDVGGGTVLDNTLVVHVKEVARNHNMSPLTFVVAGGPNLITGDRYSDYGGRPHNDLLLTLCHKMGVMDESFGDPSITTGPLQF